MDNTQQIQDLLRRIDTLNNQQSAVQSTIEALKEEVNALAIKINNSEHNSTIISVNEDTNTPLIISENKTEETESESLNTIKQETSESFTPPQYKPNFEVSKSLEAFIGENLASKVGIIITVLGISIGVKYAIDHDLISHWGRIILGYLAGCGLLEAAFKLRQKDEKYEDLSNIILSGGFASVFFVTYAAYSFYGLMPQSVAFGIMVLITAITVAAALKYDQQLIAVGGLVGAYAIPFLLSTGEDRPITLFTYVAIINIAILFISFKKDWRILFYLAFAITWSLFIAWISANFINYQRTAITMTFLTVFFAIFYTIFIAYKFIKNKENSVPQTLVLLSNAAFFYGFGYIILVNNNTGQHYVGVFTLFNALIHLIISKFVYERDLADRPLFNLLSRLGIFFITMAIAVQFDGMTVTLLLAAEMVLLFWFGRTKNLPVYRISMYPLWVLTVFSLVDDWSDAGYFNNTSLLKSINVSPVLNSYLLTTIIVIIAFIVVLKMVHNDEKETINVDENNLNSFSLLTIFLVFFTTIAIVVLFDGITVTLLWTAEMVFLFWFGRTKNLPIFDISTYPLWLLTIFSLLNDWLEGGYLRSSHYNDTIGIPTFFNIYFITSAIVIAAFIAIAKIHFDEDNTNAHKDNQADKSFINSILVTIIVTFIYLLFFNEIANYFSWKYTSILAFNQVEDANINRFKILWLINYTVLFTAILNVLNLRKYKNTHYALVAGTLGTLSVSLFLIIGLYTLGTLKNAYLYNENNVYYYRTFGGLFLRYISYVLIAGLIYLLKDNKNTFFKDDKDIQKGFDIGFSIVLLWILSSEMVHWLELSGYTQVYKWAISVLFGIFALGLVGFGIDKKKKHLRISAIVLFVLTLIKVFVFDLMGLDTIAKTIVMTSLGVLLLIISFLYTKFKNTFLGDE